MGFTAYYWLFKWESRIGLSSSSRIKSMALKLRLTSGMLIILKELMSNRRLGLTDIKKLTKDTTLERRTIHD